MVDLIEKKKDTVRQILIVTHGGVMRSMYSYLNGDNLDVFYNVFFNNVATMRTKYITDRLVINAIYSPVELMKLFAE